MAKLTPAQRHVLAFIHHFQITRRRSPSLYDICNEFGYSSKNSAAKKRDALKKAGKLDVDAFGHILFPLPDVYASLVSQASQARQAESEAEATHQEAGPTVPDRGRDKPLRAVRKMVRADDLSPRHPQKESLDTLGPKGDAKDLLPLPRYSPLPPEYLAQSL